MFLYFLIILINKNGSICIRDIIYRKGLMLKFFVKMNILIFVFNNCLNKNF